RRSRRCSGRSRRLRGTFPLHSASAREADAMTARRTVLLIPLAAIALLAAGCSSAPPPMTVHGTLEIAVQDYSEFQADYPAATNGNAQVTITDPSGKVI